VTTLPADLSRPCMVPPAPRSADPRADALDMLGAYLDPVGIDLEADLCDPEGPLRCVPEAERVLLWTAVYAAQDAAKAARKVLTMDTEPGEAEASEEEQPDPRGEFRELGDG
jgi:hypothetical protein